MQQPCLIRQGPRTQKLLHLGLRRGQARAQGGAGADTEPIQLGPAHIPQRAWTGWARSTGSQALHERGSAAICAYRQWLAKGLGQQSQLHRKKNSKHFASSSSPILPHSASKGNVGLLLSIFLQTRARHPESALLSC